jgi:hypothetical protein
MEDWEKILFTDTAEKELNYKGVKILYKKLSWPEIAKIEGESITTKLVNDKPQIMINAETFTEKILNTGIIKGPWEASMKSIAIRKFNDELKNLLVTLIKGIPELKSESDLKND